MGADAEGAVAFLTTTLLQIYRGIFQRKKILKIGKDLTELWPRVCGLSFLAHPYTETQKRH